MPKETEYRPGGPWLFASPFVQEVWGWESPTCKEPNEEKVNGEKVNCVLPAELYAKLPGGHEHSGTRLYHSKDEALKALAIAKGEQ